MSPPKAQIAIPSRIDAMTEMTGFRSANIDNRRTKCL